MGMIASDMLITRSKDIMASEIEDDLVMMNLDNNAYYGLNKMGRKIWELLAQEQTLESLCHALVKTHDVTPQQCHKDVSALLLKLQAIGLVSVE